MDGAMVAKIWKIIHLVTHVIIHFKHAVLGLGKIKVLRLAALIRETVQMLPNLTLTSCTSLVKT